MAVEGRFLCVRFYAAFWAAERHVVVRFVVTGARRLVEIRLLDEQLGAAASSAVSVSGAEKFLGPPFLGATFFQDFHGEPPG